MIWDNIAKQLLGRTAMACRLRFQNYLETKSQRIDVDSAWSVEQTLFIFDGVNYGDGWPAIETEFNDAFQTNTTSVDLINHYQTERGRGETLENLAGKVRSKNFAAACDHKWNLEEDILIFKCVEQGDDWDTVASKFNQEFETSWIFQSLQMRHKAMTEAGFTLAILLHNPPLWWYDTADSDRPTWPLEHDYLLFESISKGHGWTTIAAAYNKQFKTNLDANALFLHYAAEVGVGTTFEGLQQKIRAMSSQNANSQDDEGQGPAPKCRKGKKAVVS